MACCPFQICGFLSFSLQSSQLLFLQLFLWLFCFFHCYYVHVSTFCCFLTILACSILLVLCSFYWFFISFCISVWDVFVDISLEWLLCLLKLFDCFQLLLFPSVPFPDILICSFILSTFKLELLKFTSWKATDRSQCWRWWKNSPNQSVSLIKHHRAMSSRGQHALYIQGTSDHSIFIMGVSFLVVYWNCTSLIFCLSRWE